MRARTAIIAVGAAALLAGVYVYAPREVDGLSHPLGAAASRYRVSSRFGPRISPITGAPSTHQGIDLAVPTGTPVYAVGPGEVYWIGEDPNASSGLAVGLRWDGLKFLYFHLSEIRAKLGAVERGTVLGLSGSTGRSTGPHLHFEVRSDVTGLPLDPESVFPAGTFA